MDATADFNFVTQFSEQFLNRLLKALYLHKVFPTHFVGQLSRTEPRYGITITFDYELDIGEPTLYLDTGTAGGVGFRGTVTGELRLAAGFEPRPGEPALPPLRKVIPVQAEFEAVVRLALVTAGEQSFLELVFIDLPDLKLELQMEPFPHNELVSRLVKRGLLVKLRNQVKRIPISQLIETFTLGGWAVAEPALRIIDGPDEYDSVTVAMNTFPNRGLGRPDELNDFTNAPERSFDFGLGVNQALLLQTLDRAWQRGQIPRRFDDEGRPNPNGLNTVSRFAFDLQDGRILLSVFARRQAGPVEPEIGVHAIARIQFADGDLRVDLSDVRIEYPWLMHLLGFLVLNVVWLIVFRMLDGFLGRLVEREGESALDDFLRNNLLRLSFEGIVPGTNLKLVGRPLTLTTRANELVSQGQIDIEIVGS